MSKPTKSTKALFDKRVKYNNNASGISALNNMNNWGLRDFMYCRVNKRQRVITPLEMSATKPFPPPSDGTIYALDFVVEAFQEMREFYSSSIANQAIHGLRDIKDLSPVRGYMKSIDLYLAHQEDLKVVLFEKYLIPNRRRIYSFRTFLKQFMRFVWTEAASLPILYSSFVHSPYCPMHSTGLVVEVADEDHNANNPKYKIMFDQNFDFFSNMAHEFGFVVARHAPWMFVANLDSSKMHKNVEFYDMPNPNMHKILGQYFYECKDFDIDLMRRLMYDSYYELVVNDPTRTDLEICNNRTKQTLVLERLETLEQINADFTKLEWLDLYFRILLAERGQEMNKQRYASFFRECEFLYEWGGFDTALNFAEMRLLKVKKDLNR